MRLRQVATEATTASVSFLYAMIQMSRKTNKQPVKDYPNTGLLNSNPVNASRLPRLGRIAQA